MPAYGIIPTRLGVRPRYSALLPSLRIICFRQSNIPLYWPVLPSASLVFSTCTPHTNRNHQWQTLYSTYSTLHGRFNFFMHKLYYISLGGCKGFAGSMPHNLTLMLTWLKTTSIKYRQSPHLPCTTAPQKLNREVLGTDLCKHAAVDQSTRRLVYSW